MNELASHFKSKEAVLNLKRKLKEMFEGRKMLFGRDILVVASEISDESLSESVIELLLENEVLKKEKAGSSIKSYLLSYNNKKAEEYFLKEANAAEVLETAYIPELEKEGEFKVVFTAPDDPHFQKQQDIYLLYPAIKKLIQKSNKTLDIINPFFDVFGTKKIIPDLLAVAKRGVNIRIITRGLFDSNDGKRNRESQKILMGIIQKARI